ncbi:VOC family protein [uncultured Caulobacter sp.]|uniref:VOC family protein n=1 Tax=uncultured Caulobacter sp. TaxID=158749 RepID=UPI00262B3C1C|nr:VOC family protein [uncultured Caulobacter sp.]
MPKITPFLWFDTQAEDAANLYVSIFPNSRITSVSRYAREAPGAAAGQVMTVTFEIDGQKVTALNAGPMFKLSEAFSFVIDCDGQDEVDHYWNALTANGGQESQCGWLKDRFGLSRQVTPRQLIEMTTSPDREAAGRAFQAMMGMKKIDIAALRAAFEGG